MTKKYIALVVALLLGSGLIYVGFIKQPVQPPPVDSDMEVAENIRNDEYHIHAGFQVYENDQLVDFAKLQYMQISPCSEDHENEAELTPEEEQIEKAHLHDMVGDVVHVHREDATWGDLFTNIEYEIYPDVTAYIDGEQVENVLEKEIAPYESMVILIGERTDIEGKLDSIVSKEHIKEIELKSENCGVN